MPANPKRKGGGRRKRKKKENEKKRKNVINTLVSLKKKTLFTHNPAPLFVFSATTLPLQFVQQKRIHSLWQRTDGAY